MVETQDPGRAKFMEEEFPVPRSKVGLKRCGLCSSTVSTKALAPGLELREPQVEERLRELAHDLEAPHWGVRLPKVAGHNS